MRRHPKRSKVNEMFPIIRVNAILRRRPKLHYHWKFVHTFSFKIIQSLSKSFVSSGLDLIGTSEWTSLFIYKIMNTVDNSWSILHTGVTRRDVKRQLEFYEIRSRNPILCAAKPLNFTSPNAAFTKRHFSIWQTDQWSTTCTTKFRRHCPKRFCSKMPNLGNLLNIKKM